MRLSVEANVPMPIVPVPSPSIDFSSGSSRASASAIPGASSEGIPARTSSTKIATRLGSKWVPAQRSSSSSAASIEIAA